MNKNALYLATIFGLLGISFYNYYLSPSQLNSEKKTMNKHILIYSKKYCPYCINAKKFFMQKGLIFEEIDIGTHPRKRQEMLDKSQGQHTVPQIFIDDHHIGGYSDLMELHESGALNGILLNKD